MGFKFPFYQKVSTLWCFWFFFDFILQSKMTLSDLKRSFLRTLLSFFRFFLWLPVSTSIIFFAHFFTWCIIKTNFQVQNWLLAIWCLLITWLGLLVWQFVTTNSYHFRLFSFEDALMLARNYFLFFMYFCSKGIKL